MTDYQKRILDKKLKEFNSFMDFHKFAYENDIIFNCDEWNYFRDKMKKILSEKDTHIINVNLDNLILP